MNLMKKFLASCLMALMCFSPSAFAETQEVSAEGEYRLGQRDTQETAKEVALADAKRKLAEQIGFFVESYSEANNFKLTQDQIKVITRAAFKLIDEQVKFSEDGSLCKVVVIALIDTDNFDKVLFDDSDQGNHLHRYKVFNEGMTWQEANQRCKALGGHLATITSEQEQGEIYKLIMQEGVKHGYWLGGFRNHLGNWEWVTDEPFTYAHWGYGEPNNAGGVEDTIMLLGDAKNVNKFWLATWNDIGSDGSDHPYYGIANFGFICEWDS